MAKEKEIKIIADAATKELVIREGSASPIILPKAVRLSGIITAPAEFIQKRKELIDPKSAYVLFNYDKGKIVLVLNERFPDEEYRISGELRTSDELKQFDIFTGLGSPKMFSIRDLIQILKFNKKYFFDASQCDTIIENLGKLTIEVSQKIEKEEVQRGNKADNFNQQVKTNIPLNFVLKMPVYKGFPEKKFQVDILFDVRDRALSLWLESVELSMILISESREIIESQLTKMNEYVLIEE